MRKICVVVASRANYGRVRSVLQAIKNHPDLELQVIAGASVLLDRFGSAINVMKKDGFDPQKKIYYVVEGENLNTQAKSTGLGIIELSTAFEELKPDVVITVADRFETMATAIAASYMNIPLAHIQGGEITGNIDESVRHAITKLSHYHFPSTEESKERLIKMGEEPWRILNSGCPAMDALEEQSLDLALYASELSRGVGYEINPREPYILMVQHPTTTTPYEGRKQVEQTLFALNQTGYQILVLWPNADAGSDMVSRGLRIFREKNPESKFRYFKNFSPTAYNAILANASCTVGNSSSFIREGSYLGVPSVIVGDRQEGREHGKNIQYAGYKQEDILSKVKYQLEHGYYDPEHIFGHGDAGKIIADYLATVKLDIHKRMTY